MTLEQAYRLLHPDMRVEEITKIFAMTNSVEYVLDKKREAHMVACDCLKRCMEVEDDGK